MQRLLPLPPRCEAAPAPLSCDNNPQVRHNRVATKHLKKVYESDELSKDATCANFAQVADNGKTYQYKFYSLPAIIAVGYRINSGRAIQFRQWATKVLNTFTKQGYVLDKSRLINGQIFDEDYFDHLISEIQEIRSSSAFM